MLQKAVVPIVFTVFAHAQAAEEQPIVVVLHHAHQQHSKTIKGIASTTTIAQLKQAITSQFSPFIIPTNAQTLSVQKSTSICWFCSCKKVRTTRLLDDQKTCAAYGITSDTLIKLDIDFVTTAALQGCQLEKEERKATSPAQPSILQIPAQQLLTAVPEEEVSDKALDVKQSP